MRATWRFGLLYLLALLLLFALGHRNQVERAHLGEMEKRLRDLKAQEEALLKEGWALGQPLRVLEWAEKEGFVPMSEGRWNP